MITQSTPVRTLIVDDGRSGTGLWLARELASSGHRVGLATAVPTGFVARSRAVHQVHRVPSARADHQALIEALLPIASSYDVAVATGDAEQLALAAASDRLPLALAQPAESVLHAVLDKERVTEAASAVGIRTPQTWPVHALPADAPALLAVKRRLHWSGEHGARSTPTRILTAAQTRALDDDGLIAQEVVSGALGALVLVLDKSGVVIARHQQVADAVYPVGAGNCVRGHTVPIDPRREQQAVELLRSLGFWGLAQLEYVEASAGGRPALIDVNPRPYGSMGLAVAAGLRPASALVAIALGHVPTPSTSASGVRYSSLGLDLRRSLRERRGGLPLDAAGALIAAVGATHAVWDRADARPALRQWRQTAGRLGARVTRRGKAGEPS